MLIQPIAFPLYLFQLYLFKFFVHIKKEAYLHKFIFFFEVHEFLLPLMTYKHYLFLLLLMLFLNHLHVLLDLHHNQ